MKLTSCIETGRNIHGHQKGSTVMKAFITDGKREKLTGLCVYIIKPSTLSKEITVQNIEVCTKPIHL